MTDLPSDDPWSTPLDTTGTPSTDQAAPAADWTPITPVPDEAPRTLPPHSLGKPSAKWPYRDPAGKLLFIVCRFDLVDGGKSILPLTFCQHPDGRREWRWKGLPTPRPLYGLDRLAARPSAPVLVVEGEKTADAAAALFPDYVTITSPNGAKSADKADWSPLAGRVVTIWPDHDEEGRAYAADVARLALAAGAVLVSVVAVPDAFPPKWDLADATPEGRGEAGLRGLLIEAKPVAMVEGAAPMEPPQAEQPPPAEDERDVAPGSEDEVEIARLASLNPLDYERERPAAAKRLGCRPAILDTLVKQARTKGKEDDAQGTALQLPSPEPWPHPVDGATLLADLIAGVLRYVVMEAGSAEAIAMWVLHAHCLNAFPISPKLAITSPEKRCGKTTCLDVVAALVPRPLRTVNTTGPAIFRTIEAMQPTLLMDEADTFLTDNDDLRGILNSGHRRSSAWVIRLVGDDHEPRQFSTWAATVIAMIGRLPDTLEDRSIPVVLRRKLPAEVVAVLRADRTPDLDILARKAARWAADNFDRLAEADPIIPAGIHNRSADNWRPLLAVADAAGGEWPVRARRVAEGIAEAGNEGEQSAKVMLLDDIRAAFEDMGRDRLSSADLVSALVAMEGRPWCEWKHGKPITQNSLARQLQPFNLVPGNLRVHGQVMKGYRLEQFRDAFARYIPIPPAGTATPLQMAETLGVQAESQPLQQPLHPECSGSKPLHGERSGLCSGSKNPATPQETAICSGVAVQTPGHWEIEL